MILRIVSSLLLAAVAVCCRLKLDTAPALWVWTAIAGALCALGGALIASQPLSTVTIAGRIGGCFARWGYGVTRGRLIPAIFVSWLVWTILGAGVIAITGFRGEPKTAVMAAAWTVDSLALLRLIGIMISNRRVGSLGSLALILVGMMVGSFVLWRMFDADGAQTAALILAGGIPVIVVGGYGVMILMVLVTGKQVRWN